MAVFNSWLGKFLKIQQSALVHSSMPLNHIQIINDSLILPTIQISMTFLSSFSSAVGHYFKQERSRFRKLHPSSWISKWFRAAMYNPVSC